MYEHVLNKAGIRSGTSVLDCGCGAGRFLRLAVDRGARVAGIDAADGLVQIAVSGVPEAEVRVGDFEALPWPDHAFDVVTGFSTFQFADDHAGALREARRVTRGQVWVVIPTRLAESGIPQVFASLTDLLPANAVPSLKLSGMYALSATGKLDEVLAVADLRTRSDATVDGTVEFPDVEAAIHAFLSAGATTPAFRPGGRRAGLASRARAVRR
ncbi:MAG: class I SAM-dependent methyltransferase [Geodermatophilaceae bacterium]|nr:class I SAM-dependent methyltransferase [Geodermatophilaceae bacterium]